MPLLRTLAGWSGSSVDRLARPSTPRISQRGPELLAGRLPKLALQKLGASRVVSFCQTLASLHPVEVNQAGVRRFVEGRQRDEPAGGLDGRVGVPRGSLEIEQPGKSVPPPPRRAGIARSASTPRRRARGSRARRETRRGRDGMHLPMCRARPMRTAVSKSSTSSLRQSLAKATAFRTLRRRCLKRSGRAPREPCVRAWLRLWRARSSSRSPQRRPASRLRVSNWPLLIASTASKPCDLGPRRPGGEPSVGASSKPSEKTDFQHGSNFQSAWRSENHLQSRFDRFLDALS